MKSKLGQWIAQVEAEQPMLSSLPMSTWMVLGLAVLTLGLGAVYSVGLGEATRFCDEQLYLRLAASLVDTHTYSFDGATPTAYRPPGYNFALYPVFWLGGKVVHVRLMQFGLLALSIVLLHYLLRAWSYPLASLVAGLAVFAYPVQFFAAGTIYPQTVTTFVFLLVCVCVIRPQVTLRQWVLGGLRVWRVVADHTDFFGAAAPVSHLALDVEHASSGDDQCGVDHGHRDRHHALAGAQLPGV